MNTLNPQRVILGGSLAGVLELARPEIEHALEQYAFDPGHPVELVLPHFGVDSALLGAAELAFAGLLEDPFLRQGRAALDPLTHRPAKRAAQGSATVPEQVGQRRRRPAGEPLDVAGDRRPARRTAIAV